MYKAFEFVVLEGVYSLDEWDRQTRKSSFNSGLNQLLKIWEMGEGCFV